MALSASGIKISLVIIFKGKNICDQWATPDGTDCAGTMYATTKNRWMEVLVISTFKGN